MIKPQLVLTLPTGNVTATSLGLEGLASRRSPGSGKHFHGRKIFIDLKTDGESILFDYLDEGGWRDSVGDTLAAISGVRAGSRTKTALSNSAFNTVPVSAYNNCSLVKTGGEVLTLEPATELIRYRSHECDERMTSEQVAQRIELPFSGERIPRLYMVLAPVEFVMLSNLTPEEYGWYATHRSGKCFRQIVFTELQKGQPQVAAQSRFERASRELAEKISKKTKTISFDDCLSQIPFQDWVGYKADARGGLYVGDRNHLKLYPFPDVIPHKWDKVEG